MSILRRPRLRWSALVIPFRVGGDLLHLGFQFLLRIHHRSIDCIAAHPILTRDSTRSSVLPRWKLSSYIGRHLFDSRSAALIAGAVPLQGGRYLRTVIGRHTASPVSSRISSAASSGGDIFLYQQVEDLIDSLARSSALALITLGSDPHGLAWHFSRFFWRSAARRILLCPVCFSIISTASYGAPYVRSDHCIDL